MHHPRRPAHPRQLRGSGSLSSGDDDSSDDIVKVEEPIFDHFYEQDWLPEEKTVKGPVGKRSFESPVSMKRPVGCSFVDFTSTSHEAIQAFTYQKGDQAVVVIPLERQPPPDTSSSGSSWQMHPQLNPSGDYEEAEHNRMAQMTPDQEVVSLLSAVPRNTGEQNGPNEGLTAVFN